MVKDPVIGQIEEMVETVLGDDNSYFLVDVKIKPTNNVKVYLDGDKGITIEKCVQVNRALYKKMEETGLFPDGDFSLEVSSPGLDEPLKLIRQYRKNVGRRVEVQLLDGTLREGKLAEVSEDGIIVEETPAKNKKAHPGKSKHAVPVSHAILFNNIKTTRIQVVF
jgi:ribosome maturation factor RimP